MRAPTSGTSVFSPVASAGVAGTVVNTEFPIDMQMLGLHGGWAYSFAVYDRLRGLPSDTTTENLPETTSVKDHIQLVVNRMVQESSYQESNMPWAPTPAPVPAPTP